MSIINDVAGKLSDRIGQESNNNLDIEVVKYFYIRLFNNLIFYIIFIPLAIMLHLNLLAYLFVMGSYYALRRCWGGAHIKSDIGCLILSIITMALGTWLSERIITPWYVLIGINIMAFGIVKWTDIVDTPAKRIVKLRPRFRKQGFIALFTLLIVNICLILNPEFQVFCNAVIIGMVMELTSLIIGKYANG